MAYTADELKRLKEAAQRLGVFDNARNTKVRRIRGVQDPKVREAEAAVRKTQRQAPKMETLEERRDRLLQTFALKPLRPLEVVPPYDVTDATRYPAVEITGKQTDRTQALLDRYRHVMKEQGVTPAELKQWRTQYMLMTPEQLASFLRVTARTVRNWENGSTPVPFSVWWVMHVHLQDPEVFLSRPGFHDYYIDYVDGEAFLCSRTWPDIRYSTAQLYINRAALTEVLVMREDLREQAATIERMEAENTRLRQMLKAGTIAAELKAMHEHIGEMMDRMHTADLVEFPVPNQQAIEAEPQRQAGGWKRRD